MSLKFLIDECLSPELVRMAHDRGHFESTCVRDRGWSGLKDHELMRHVGAEDFTLVTTNSYDFRGSAGGPPGGLHAKMPIHAGLVCLNSALPMHIDRQRDLFALALEELVTRPDLINRALEVTEDETGEVTIDEYEIP